MIKLNKRYTGGHRSDGWWAVDPETGTLINLCKYGNKVYRIVSYRRQA
jgi:uncharacterized membrane protein